MLKQRLIGLIACLIRVVCYPFLSHRATYWRKRLLGIAFTARNRRAFKRLGDGVYLSSDLTLRGAEFIEIGAGTGIGKGCSLTVWPQSGTLPCLVIGEQSSIGEGAHITAAKSIRIGSHVLLGKNVTITDNNHGEGTLAEIDTPPNKRPLVSKGPVVIEDNVWIGDKATILAGLTVGRGAIIAANSVVTADVPSGSIVAGAPAKVIRKLV